MSFENITVDVETRNSGGKVLVIKLVERPQLTQVGFDDNIVMLGTPLDESGNPKRLRDLPDRHSSVMCYVDDVDAHFARAKAAGAKIIAEPEDQFYGDRTYVAQDPEGHRWFFAQHVEDEER